MSNKFIITLRVFDRLYRLKILRKDEQKYRDAAVAIEKKTTQYRNYFADSGSEKLHKSDYLAMTAIQALSETVSLQSETLTYEQRIKGLILDLDNYLIDSK